MRREVIINNSMSRVISLYGGSILHFDRFACDLAYVCLRDILMTVREQIVYMYITINRWELTAVRKLNRGNAN